MCLNLKFVALLVLVTLPLTAAAEQRGRSQQQRARTARAEALAPPAGLAEALLPAGARRLPPARFQAPRDGWNRWPQTGRGWWKHQRHGFYPYPYGSYYAVPYTGFSAFIPGEEYHPAPPPPPATNKGMLRLELTPATSFEYFIDGHYVGSSSSLGTQFEVNAGARQIEIRARGYQPLTFDARIDEGRVTTLRGNFEAIEQGAQAPRATGSGVMYVIPGCYIGNAKPVASALPPGCDARKTVTRGPGL